MKGGAEPSRTHIIYWGGSYYWFSGLIDKHVLRQLVMTVLQVDEGFDEEFDQRRNLKRVACTSFSAQWNEPTAAHLDPVAQEESDHEDQDADLLISVDEVELFRHIGSAELAAEYEMEGLGQQRHWVQQSLSLIHI